MRLCIVVLLIFLAGCDNNQNLKYGETGFPKNCRAIIKANIDGYHSGEYSADEALNSINRNCGEFGLSW